MGDRTKRAPGGFYPSYTTGKSNGPERQEQAQRGEDRGTAFKSHTSNFRHPCREPAQTVDDLNELESEYIYAPGG
jgi:hypothetical protein